MCSVDLHYQPVNGHLFIEKQQTLALNQCLELKFHLGVQVAWLDFEPWETED